MRRAARRIVVWGLGLTAAACAGTPRPPIPADAAPKLGDEWFTWRAAQLGVSEDEARARDAALSEDTPPEGPWTEPVRAQIQVAWRDLCAKCHGLEGRLEGVPQLDPPARKWGGMGASMGFFFGGDRMRAGLYRRIRDGGEPKEGSESAMPPWKDSLSREQIWGLVDYIEAL